MAKAPPPEPIDHHYDIGRLTKVFAISSFLVLPAFVWMVKQDFDRDWKKWQTKFLTNDRERTRSAKEAAAEKIDAGLEASYIEKKREAARELRRNRSALEKAEAVERKGEGRWYLADQEFRFRKAEMDSARYEYETAQKEAPKAGATESKRKRYLALAASYDESQLREQAAQSSWNAAKAEVAGLRKGLTDAEEALKKLDEDYDRYQAKLKTLRRDAFFLIRNGPVTDMLAPSLKVQQVQLDGLYNDVNFLKSQRVDRCMTCHIAADKRGFEDKVMYPESVLRTHPRLDLFVDGNSPHPYATFGCTSCHGGRDRATDFTRAGHMPDDFELWEHLHGSKDHLAHRRAAPKKARSDRFRLEDLKRPRELALRLRDGKDPLSTYLKGTLEPAASSALGSWDGTGAPSEEVQKGLVAALNKAIETDLWDESRFAGVTLSEGLRIALKRNVEGTELTRRSRFLLEEAYPDALGEVVTARWKREYDWEVDKFNDLPMLPMKAVEAGCFRCHKNEAGHTKAVHLDQGRKLVENLGCWSCHKMKGLEDLPKVGPTLRRVASKSTPEWAARWLANPREFRHNTKMPRFFGLENFEGDPALTDTMVAGVVAYLFERSEKWVPAAQAPTSGDAARGKLLFESLGCQGCHVSDPAAERHVMDGWRQHGPNLVGLADKVSPAWLAAWLKDPKAYNPETRMPNLRLADDEIADLVAYLGAKPASDAFRAMPVAKADEAARDKLVLEYLSQSKMVVEAKAELARMTPKQKDLFVGEKIIGHYGCYACHNIPGFEKAKPIGVELSEWGNKPVHLLDFGFVTLPETRADWLHQKVSEPRSFDRQKVKTFQEKLKMPQFSLSESEIRAIQSTVLGMQKDDMADALKARLGPERSAIEVGRKLVKEYNCQGCHILEDRGGQIRETLPDVALAPPNIRGEGAKVQSDWLFSFLSAPKSGEIRPWLKVRMPTFEFTPDQLNGLTHYFAAMEKARYPFEPKVQTVESRSREAGAATFAALKCAQCHPTSPEAFQQALKEGKTPADLAPMLSVAHTRLRYDWINDWVKRPDEWMPGTRMPTNFPRADEKSDKRISPLAPALDTPTFADLKKQLVAIFGSEAEAKAYIGDPDRVTKALRDHVWTLGQPVARAERAPAVPPARAREVVASAAPSR